MRRGCISLGNVQCDECHRTIAYPERYLAVDEKDGSADEHEPSQKNIGSVADSPSINAEEDGVKE